MSGHDFLGNAIAIDDPEVIGSWNEVIRAVLAHAATAPTALQAVLDRAPNFALAQAARGLMMMTLARREMVALARSCHDTAKRHASDPREQGYVKALGSWIAGDPLRASDDLDAVAAAYPSDVLAVKLAHQIRFMAGDA
ncbi:MAG: tetratricopeptide repeat protein, partial [Alphaproteobacteria bacterium]